LKGNNFRLAIWADNFFAFLSDSASSFLCFFVVMIECPFIERTLVAGLEKTGKRGRGEEIKKCSTSNVRFANGSI